jgi:hypothetical protein
MRLMPLPPVIARTVGGATKMPVPTILFSISALFRVISSYNSFNLHADHLLTRLKDNQDNGWA